MAYGWTDGFEKLSEMGLQETRQRWFGTLLYLEYLHEVSPEGVMNGFEPRARYRADQDIGRSTVEQIREGNIDPTSRINLIPGGVNPLEMPRTGATAPPITDADTTFEEWLENQKLYFDMGRFGSIS